MANQEAKKAIFEVLKPLPQIYIDLLNVIEDYRDDLTESQLESANGFLDKLEQLSVMSENDFIGD